MGCGQWNGGLCEHKNKALERRAVRSGMHREAEFNRFASDEFIREYMRETGEEMRFKRLGDPFPDAILEPADGAREIGVEFVSIVLPFLSQEEAYLKRYWAAFYEAIRLHRPKYKNSEIRLQLSSRIVEGQRPFKFPDVGSSEGKQIITEFVGLLSHHFDDLSTVYGGSAGGGLLAGLRMASGELTCPTLSRNFDSILFDAIDDDDPRKPHPDDPVILPPVSIYLTTEIATAVARAFFVKRDKGSAYRTDILVLHTLPEPGKPHIAGVGVQAENIAELGRALATQQNELSGRFREIWFLNAYTTQGKRLYRLK